MSIVDCTDVQVGACARLRKETCVYLYQYATVISIKYYHLAITVFCPCRFHNPVKEPALNYDVVLPVDDDIQLSVVQYRNKLYEVKISQTGNIQLNVSTLEEPNSKNIM